MIAFVREMLRKYIVVATSFAQNSVRTPFVVIMLLAILTTILFFCSITLFCSGVHGADNFLWIPFSSHKTLNSSEVNSPPLFERRAFMLLPLYFSTNALNFSKVYDLFFKK